MSIPAELVITVTADDIAKGTPRDGCDCPIALAVRRLYPGASHVFIGGDLTRTIGVHWGALMASYAMPDEAVDFTLCFDRIASGTVAPFTFTALVIP